MITDKSGAAAVADVEAWAGGIVRNSDQSIETAVYHDADSSTYVMRLAKGTRVLLFRLSEAQVQSPQREGECEKIMKAKIKEISAKLM